MAGLTHFLLTADPAPLPLADVWNQSARDTSSDDFAIAADQAPVRAAPHAVAVAGDHNGVPTLGNALRLHPSLFQDDGVVRLLLFCVLQQLLGDERPNCQLDAIAVTPQLWPLRAAPCQPSSLDPADSNSTNPGVCPYDLPILTSAWASGQLSNYEYLLHLNRLVGRRCGDPTRSPILPWVLDMTADPDAPPQPGEEAGGRLGWRDLGKSKWRLAKGDEQLDSTYHTSPVPHHLPGDPLSDVAYCIYKARQLPEALLTRVVRGRFNTQEYPVSLERLYQLTPDECIPELYCDAAVLKSVHPTMPDLALPAWAQTAEEFIAKHRAALESDYVSSHLHHWIDLTFGYKLRGMAAVEAKNVTLAPPTSADGRLGTAGYVQLFFSPHPKRKRGLQREAADLQGPPTSLTACLQQLGELEVDASSTGEWDGGSMGRGAHCSGQHGLPPLAVQFGQLMVQLYLQRAVHVCPLDSSAWRSLLPHLPPAARRLAAACLGTHLSLADVAVLDFFHPAVRAAHAFLAPLHSYRAGSAALRGQEAAAAAGQRVSGFGDDRVSDAAVPDLPPGVLQLEGSSSGDCTCAMAAAAQPDTQATQQPGSSGSTSASSAFMQDPAPPAQPHEQLRRQLLHLAQRVAEGKLLELLVVPGALQLCLPAILAVLQAVLQQQPKEGRQQDGGAMAGQQGVPQGDQDAVGVLLGLLGTAPRTLCSQHVLPAVASWLGNAPGAGAGLPRESRLALLSPQVVCGMVAAGGVAAFMETVQPVLLRQLLVMGGGGSGTEAAAVAALCSVARQVAPAITFEGAIRSLLRALPSCPAAALALVELAACLPPHLAANYVLLQLLQLFDPGREWNQGFVAPLVPSATLNTLAAVEGLAPLLPAALSLRHIIGPIGGPLQDEVAPSHLMAALLQPEQQGLWRIHPAIVHAALTRIAGLVIEVCRRSGPEALVKQLLPQLVPLFTCSDSHRLNYGMHLPSSSPSKQPPRAPPSAQAMNGTLPATHPLLGAAAGGSHASTATSGARTAPLQPGEWGDMLHGSEGDAWAGGAAGSDSGYWDVVSILYPPCVEAVGAEALHSLVPNWSVIELNLSVRYEWSPSAARGLSTTVLRQLLPAVRDLAMRYCTNPRYSSGTAFPAIQEALRRVEATSRLIDGVAWLSPSSAPLEDAPKAAPGPGVAPSPRQGALPTHPGASSASAGAGGRPLPWAWRSSPDADWVATLASGGAGAALDFKPEGGVGNWQLQAVALHEFRAHKDRLRLCLADEDSQVVITAGKGQVGSRECEVIRTWALGDGEPGAQYVQHDTAAVTSMCLVGGRAAAATPYVASCDATGALHVWSLASGEQAYCLREPPGHRVTSSWQLRCRGWLQGAAAAGGSAGSQPAGYPSVPHPSETSLDHGRESTTPPTLDPHAPVGQVPGAGLTPGFTRVANVGGRGEGGWEGGLVAAGTSGGCLCLLDLERGELAGHFDSTPSAQGSPGASISALCCGGAWMAAGTSGGWVSVVDTRSGEVLWWFRRHEAAVTALGAYRGHYLVSAAKEGAVKLWDLRMGATPRDTASHLPPAGAPPTGAHSHSRGDPGGLLPSLATGASIPLCLGSFKMGGGDAAAAPSGGVGGLAMYGQQACICYTGSSLGIINLTPGGGSRSSRVGVTRLLGAGGAAVGAGIRGLTILPLSRLFVVGTEDGWLRICR